MPVFGAISHTVRLVVYVPIALAHGDGWTWAALPQADPVGHEFVYSGAELTQVLRIWGSIVTRVLVGTAHDRFALAAYGMVTGAILGRDVWIRSAETGQLKPHGSPWCVWDEQVRAATARGIVVPAR
jgi:hypothetical protein